MSTTEVYATSKHIQYEQGHRVMQRRLASAKHDTAMAVELLTKTRQARARETTASDRWFYLLGGTVALLQAFPHLSHHSSKGKI
jgi:hypothetical protein